ncbi:hypothetical protein [Niabella aquatica]
MGYRTQEITIADQEVLDIPITQVLQGTVANLNISTPNGALGGCKRIDCKQNPGWALKKHNGKLYSACQKPLMLSGLLRKR